jgi:hypothetical protein
MVIGLPVIFHAGGLLATAYLPDSLGKCSSYEEVNSTLKRLEEGDLELRNAIITYQNTVIDQLRVVNNVSIFDQLLNNIVGV